MEEINDEYYLPVQGAGKIRIGKYFGARTGTAVGFSIGVEWGRHGYAGGVIDQEDAIDLARHILRTINLEQLTNDDEDTNEDL